LVWIHNPPKPEEMPCHYGTDYHKAITTAGELSHINKWRRERILKLRQGGTLLDVGCSSGGVLRALGGNAWKLYGIETSMAEARKAEMSSGAQVFVGDILDAPFSPLSFDVITLFHVLEHVDRPKDVIRKLWEWLKPGGIVYLQVPNVRALEACIFRSYWYALELPRHLYHFSPVSLKRLFSLFEFEELLLSTLSHNHIEASMRYVLDDVLSKFGILRTPPATAIDSPGIPWRIIRRAFRYGLLKPLGYLAAAAGRGAGIEAAFRKRTP
jgi:SAM-dependent methyltransferase